MRKDLFKAIALGICGAAVGYGMLVALYADD